MGSEKYRVETSGFDLTLGIDPEATLVSGVPSYELITPLPTGLTANDFFGKIAEIRLPSGLAGGTGQYKFYGVLTNISELKTVASSVYATAVYATISYSFLDMAVKTIRFAYMDMILPDGSRVSTVDAADVIDPAELVSSSTITLTATPNYNGTGYTKYEGSGTIPDNTNSSLVRYGILALKVGSIIYYTSVASVVSASGGTKKLTLSDYAGFGPTEVDDVDITIGKASGGSYPITVSFVVGE